MRQMDGFRAMACIMSAATVVLLGGCESTPKANGLDRAMADYEASRYHDAHRNAVEAMRTTGAAERAEAAYLAGMSAYRMNNLNEADLRFRAATRSGDRELTGRAQAMLGQIRLDQGRPRDAAEYFEAAADALTGEDARQAARHAAFAHQEAGNENAARRWDRRGPTVTPTSASSSEARGLFTLQVGAFTERQRAEQAAMLAESFAQRAGDDQVRIVPSTDRRGRRLYFVQFGSFETRSSAAAARDRIGRLDYIVAPMASAAR